MLKHIQTADPSKMSQEELDKLAQFVETLPKRSKLRKFLSQVSADLEQGVVLHVYYENHKSTWNDYDW